MTISVIRVFVAYLEIMINCKQIKFFLLETREIYSLKQGFPKMICTFCIISTEKLNLSVIRQNGESQSGGKKKQNKAHQIFRKTKISSP